MIIKEVENILGVPRATVSENIVKLEKQIGEIRGAMNICQKIREIGERLGSFNPEKYWNTIESNEGNGNHFMDIANDVIHLRFLLNSLIVPLFFVINCPGFCPLPPGYFRLRCILDMLY